MSVKIINMSELNAKKYFLKTTSYFNLELPPYFDFQKMIDFSTNKLGNNDVKSYYNNDKSKHPKNFDDINYKFLCNKDGKYAWRPFQIIHPMLYVDLVNKITKPDNWKVLQDRFNEFKSNKKIICCSDIVESSKKKNDKAAIIKNWWSTFEQQALNLSLEFDYLAITDITDCYASIYTHSIPWAIHGKDFAKQFRDDTNLIGNIIDKNLQNMLYSQTNGIPQGSNLMDFIAEIVLGYSDMLLSKKLEENGIEDYKILRFRDDYRIFTNSNVDYEKILRFLSEILSDLNMKLNPQKTKVSNDVISTSIKADKVYWNSRKAILNSLNLQEKLLEIRDLGKLFPNCGSLTRALIKIYEEEIIKLKKYTRNINKLIIITADIMYNNPRTYDIASAILSKLLEFKDSTSLKEIINKITKKFLKLPNITYLEIWLQRIIINSLEYDFDSSICKKVFDDSIKIWNSEWLNFSFTENIVNQTEVSIVPKVIAIDEISVFADY